MENLFAKIENLVIEDIKKEVKDRLTNYMSHHNPNDMFYEVETKLIGDYLYVIAHYGLIKRKSFGCAYLKACFSIYQGGDLRVIYIDQNVLDKKHYTMEDCINNTKNYIEMLYKEIVNN